MKHGVDSGDTCGADVREVSLLEASEYAGSDVVSERTVQLEEASASLAEPGGDPTTSCKQVGPGPLQGEELEDVEEPTGRVVSPGGSLGLEVSVMLKPTLEVRSLTTGTGEYLLILVIGETGEVSEVGGPIPDVIAVGLFGKHTLGL